MAEARIPLRLALAQSHLDKSALSKRAIVISQRGMGEALGLGSSSGSRLPRFVGGKVISNYVGPELREKLENPVVFQAQVGGPEALSQVFGYDVTILIDLCKAITKAEEDRPALSRP